MLQFFNSSLYTGSKKQCLGWGGGKGVLLRRSVSMRRKSHLNAIHATRDQKPNRRLGLGLDPEKCSGCRKTSADPTRKEEKETNSTIDYVQLLPGDNIPAGSPPPVRPQAPALLSILCAPEPALDARCRHP